MRQNKKDVQYLRNAQGQVFTMPLILWHIEDSGVGIFAQFSFAESPESLAKNELGVVQLAISAEQALKLAEDLTTEANRAIRQQRNLPKM